MNETTPGPGPMKLSVVIPVYNEMATIAQVIRRVREVDLPGVAKEIIVVDDFSTDGTRSYLADLADQIGKPRLDPSAKDEGTRAPVDIKICFQDRNRGKGAALRRGFREATGDVVVIQDADLEYDPADYVRMLEPIQRGVADVVYGSRFLGGPHRVLYYWHYIGNLFLTTLSNALTNINLTDMETCYKMFRREILERIQIRQNRFGFEPEITAKVARLRCRIYEVPISYWGRTYEEGKKIGWKDGFKAIYCILRYNLLP